MILLSLLRREFGGHDIHCCVHRMMELLPCIKEIVMAFPLACGDHAPVLHTCPRSVSEEQQKIIDALGLGRLVTPQVVNESAPNTHRTSIFRSTWANSG